MDFKDEAVILCDGLFAVQIFWKSVFHNMGNVPLDQRLRVSQEIIADIGTVFRDPLSRYFLFLIADQVDILLRCFTHEADAAPKSAAFETAAAA